MFLEIRSQNEDARAKQSEGGEASKLAEPSLEQTIIAREREVWQALQDGDGAADARLLADDFIGLYETGFATKAEHVKWVGEGRVASYTMEEIRLVRLHSEAVLLLYKADFEGCQKGEDYRKTQYISSLWVWRANQWLNVFSQDTNAQ